MNTISVKQIILINTLVSGGNHCKLSESRMRLLEKIAEAPFKKETGWDSVLLYQYETSFYEYRTVVEKAAKLGCDLYRLKPFESWNTKTAIAVILTFLDINNITMKKYSDDIPALIKAMGERENYLLDTVLWITDHIKDGYYTDYQYT